MRPVQAPSPLSPPRAQIPQSPAPQAPVRDSPQIPARPRPSPDDRTDPPSKIRRLSTSQPYSSTHGSPKTEDTDPALAHHPPHSIANGATRLPPILDPDRMPHRTDPLPLHNRHQDDFARAHAHAHALAHSPHPPIATLPQSQSPSLSSSSLDRSSVSSPAPSARTSSGLAMHPSASLYPSAPMHYSHDPSDRARTYYAPPPPPPHSHLPYRDSRFANGHPHSHPSHGIYPPPTHVVPSQLSPPMHHSHDTQYPFPGQPSFHNVLYTDDAATKLSDRVRRRCFNCCTTDTSTWRRSSLNPGKVLCNKCGLFERTHSRPRPEQFPHKRGPLSGSSLRTTSTMNSASTSPPSVSVSAPQPSLLGSASQRSPQQQHLLPALPPPHTYPHPSIVPLLRSDPGSASNGSSSNGGVNGNGRLPQIHSWLDAPEGSGGANGSAARTPPETHAHHPYAHAHAARRHTLPSGARERSPP